MVAEVFVLAMRNEETRWDVVAPEWVQSSCVQTPGILLHQHLHKLPASEGRFQASESAKNFPDDSAASPRVEPLVEQREQSLASDSSARVSWLWWLELLFYFSLVSVSLFSECSRGLLALWGLNASNAGHGKWHVFHSHDPSFPLCLNSQTAHREDWELLLCKQKGRKNSRAEDWVLCVLSCGMRSNHSRSWYPALLAFGECVVPRCCSGVHPWLLIFLCTNIIEQLEFRLHYFLRKLVIMLMWCFLAVHKVKLSLENSYYNSAISVFICNLDSFLLKIVQPINRHTKM